jgi:hypothetical protein
VAYDEGTDHQSNDEEKPNALNLLLMIENVPEEIQDFLELALEDQAGGPIRSFKPDKQLGGILVTFDQREGMYYSDDFAIFECRVGNGFAAISSVLLFYTVL